MIGSLFDVDVELAQESGCLLWQGEVHARGGPRLRLDRYTYRSVPAMAVEQTYGLSLESPTGRPYSLLRACPSPACVSPYHHPLKAPGRVLRASGERRETWWAAVAALRALAAEGRTARLGWDAADLPSFGIGRELVAELAASPGWAPLTVYGAWSQWCRRARVTAERAGKSEHEQRQPRAAGPS